MTKVDVLIRRAKRKNPGKVFILSFDSDSQRWKLSCCTTNGVSRLFLDQEQALTIPGARDTTIIIDV